MPPAKDFKKKATSKYDPLDVNCTENINADMSNFDFLQTFAAFAVLFFLVKYLGYLWAIPFTYALPPLKVWVMRKFFKLHALTCMDTFFLYDNYKNRANILAIGIYHKVDK